LYYKETILIQINQQSAIHRNYNRLYMVSLYMVSYIHCLIPIADEKI
jgi:hypothetical protein